MTVVKSPIPLAHRYPIFRNGLCFLIDVFIKADSSLAQWNTILWAARPCDAGSDLREIDFDDLVVAWLRLRWIVPQALHTRSEEHTSELQSLMRNSYAVFCLNKKNQNYRTCITRTAQ